MRTSNLTLMYLYIKVSFLKIVSSFDMWFILMHNDILGCPSICLLKCHTFPFKEPDHLRMNLEWTFNIFNYQCFIHRQTGYRFTLLLKQYAIMTFKGKQGYLITQPDNIKLEVTGRCFHIHELHLHITCLN
jgi:hypothetical protein